MKFRNSIRIKVFACLLLVFLIPMLCLFVFTLNSNKEFYNRQISIIAENEVDKATEKLDGILTDIQSLLDSLIFSKYDNSSCVLSICETENGEQQLSDYDRLLNYRKFIYISSNLIQNNRYADGVYLFTESGYVYSYVKSREFYLEQDYQEQAWYQRLINLDDFQILETFQPQNPHINREQLLAARRFTTLNGQDTGILAVVCNENVFEDIEENAIPNSDSFVLDVEGQRIYGSGDMQVLSGAQLETIKKEQQGVLYKNGSQDAYVFGTIPYNSWKIIAEISLEAYYGFYHQITRYLIGIILAAVILTVTISIVASKILVGPLEKLSYVMKKVPTRTVELEKKYCDRQDEIGVLYNRFESMMKEINRLIEEKYVGEIKYLKSKMKNLMSQINSHFVFNTLENMNCLAEIEGNQSIAVMSKSLGDMLRYNIDYEEDETTLEEEVTHISKYIKIQEIRFGNAISLKLNIPDELYPHRVLKFMLQPIVENAIEHGLMGTELPWTVEIDAKETSGELLITVKDDGAGMEPEELERIRRHIYQAESGDDKKSDSIGLLNIHKRLQLLYSEDYGLEIESTPNKGVAVIIRLPS